jgi:hypothetical protein
MDDTGKVNTFINNRGSGKGLKPDWSNAGDTHQGLRQAGTRARVRLARIYGTNRRDVSRL